MTMSTLLQKIEQCPIISSNPYRKTKRDPVLANIGRGWKKMKRRRRNNDDVSTTKDSTKQVSPPQQSNTFEFNNASVLDNMA